MTTTDYTNSGIHALPKRQEYEDDVPVNQTMDDIARPALKQFQHQLPQDYDPANYPPVKLRQKPDKSSSETQRKRRSKTLLINRKSTGPINKDDIMEAIQLGPSGNP